MRKREIAFAIAMGGVAAGVAAVALEGSEDGPVPLVATQQADRMTYEVGPFEEISTIGSQDVVVTIGDTQSVRAEGSPRALGQLEVVVEDGELTIRPKNLDDVNWESLSSATYFVTVPRLERIALAGSGDVRVDRVEGESFSGSIVGRGELAIGTMQVDEADFSIGGSGSVVAAGTAREARVSIGGSGEVQAGSLRAETASIRIGGSGDVALTVSEDADVSIMGSGNVDIAGPARCSVSRFGSGDVTCNGVDVD